MNLQKLNQIAIFGSPSVLSSLTFQAARPRELKRLEKELQAAPVLGREGKVGR